MDKKEEIEIREFTEKEAKDFMYATIDKTRVGFDIYETTLDNQK